jgi:hypothetical protein
MIRNVADLLAMTVARVVGSPYNAECRQCEPRIGSIKEYLMKIGRTWAVPVMVFVTILELSMTARAANYAYPTDIPVGSCAYSDFGTYSLCHFKATIEGQETWGVWSNALISNNGDNCVSPWLWESFNDALCGWNGGGQHRDQWGIGDTGDHLVVQGDGNIVLYNGSGAAIWATGTDPLSGAYLSMQEDGNIVVYYNNLAVWSVFR